MAPTATLAPPDGGTSNYFCFGMSVSIAGDTVVVGAPVEAPLPGTGVLSGPGIIQPGGAAFVFTEPTTGWAGVAPAAALVPSDTATGDLFGGSVSISGNTVAVGAPRANIGGQLQQGAAYVFTEPASGWANMAETAKLTATDGAGYDDFGYSVSIGGNTVVVGAPYATVGGDADEGAAYVFTEPASGWASMPQTAKLIASDGVTGDQFGSAVSISGNTVLVGSLYADGNDGVAYVFAQPVSGWANTSEAAELHASDGGPMDCFGDSVCLSGNTAVAGAWAATVGGNSAQGAAYVFTVPAAATPGLYNPTTSWWYLRNSNTTGGADILAGYGPAGGNWIPLAGDWTGDGTTTIGLYDSATGYFYLHNSNTTGKGEIAFFYGDPGQGWIPVVGDWTGQKSKAGYPIDTVGMYDPKTCIWYLRNSLTTGNADITIGYGPAGQGWLPVVGDWNGGGTTTVGLYDPATGYFYLHNSNTTGKGEVAFYYGATGQNWIPVAGDWTGLGRDSIGMYDPAACVWYLRSELSTGVADITFGFGSPGAGWLPVVGDWTGSSTAQASLAGASGSNLATVSAPLVQADLQPVVATAVTGSSSLPAMTQVSYVASDQPQLPTINPQAVDQLVGLGDFDMPATSLVLPTGVRSNLAAGKVDVVSAQLS
jgi:hypothetical protein